MSNEPRRVPHFIWEKLSSKGLECVAPPVQLNEIQGCNEDAQCDDNNHCTEDACIDGFCTVSEKIPNCCGNQVCEIGELDDKCSDCTPYFLEPESYCEECFALDGFMFELKLKEDAKRDIFISSISFLHEMPIDDVGVQLYSIEGSYRGKENANSGWELLSTTNLSRSDFTEITLNPPLLLSVGSTKAFHLFASESIILFGQGASYIRNEDHSIELYSSRAVKGLFGAGIEGFSLSCSIEYSLNDRLSTSAPTSRPSMGHVESTMDLHSKGTVETPGRDSLSSHSSAGKGIGAEVNTSVTSKSSTLHVQLLSLVALCIWMLF